MFFNYIDIYVLYNFDICMIFGIFEKLFRSELWFLYVWMYVYMYMIKIFLKIVINVSYSCYCVYMNENNLIFTLNFFILFILIRNLIFSGIFL